MEVKKTKANKKSKNILYTGKGDRGTTTLFHCNQMRISKSSNIIEALGALDELNAYLGFVKSIIASSIYTEMKDLKVGTKSYVSLINEIQQTLFIIQAEVAGSKMTVSKSDLNKIEIIINKISEILPPITSFTISGGSVLSSSLDVARTLARRAERRVISVLDEGFLKMGVHTVSYLNRLSSVLFAMSRYSNHLLDIKEDHPKYHKK